MIKAKLRLLFFSNMLIMKYVATIIFDLTLIICLKITFFEFLFNKVYLVIQCNMAKGKFFLIRKSCCNIEDPKRYCVEFMFSIKKKIDHERSSCCTKIM